MKHREHRAEFIGKSIFLLAMAGFFIWAFVNFLFVTTEPYPSADSLTYEVCTFEKCERKKTSKHAYVYNIYVEEYDEPLQIGSVMDEKINHNVLQRLTLGDEIVVSVAEDKYLYSLSYGSISVLAYEDYVAEHESNSTLGIVLMACFALVGIGLFAANIICYKTKGIPLQWGRRSVRI